MSIAYRVQDYIADRRLPWDPLMHRSSNCCMDAAHQAQVPPDHVAKAVMLRGRRGGFVMAVIPANHHLDLLELGEELGDEFTLVSERRLPELFPDCAPGAVPPLGDAYGIKTLWDQHLAEFSDVYFEGGDHRTLVHMNGTDFSSLMQKAQPLPLA